MKKRLTSLALALAMALTLTVPAFAAKIDTSSMPGHEILSLLPATLQRPARPTTAEQVDFRGFGGANKEETWRLSQSRESVFQEIVELTDSLTAGKTTDREKIKAIYDWTSQNVKYGDASVSGDLYRNPFYVYVQRSGVCDGYANLCQLMCTIAEIPAVYISGAEKNATPGGPGHAWNAALADGEWIFFDATGKEWDMAPNYHDSSNYLFYFDGIFRTDVYPERETTYEVRMKLRSDFSCPARVTVPSGVTRVELPDCPSLTDVTLPDGVAFVYFLGCTGLTDVTLPDSVTSIEGAAFNGCTGLRSINLPNGLIEIGNSAFAGCTALKSVTIPDSVTTIEHLAFSGCTSLESVTIGSGITKEDVDRAYAFYGCTNLKSITFSNGGSIATDEFTIENGVLTKYSGYGGAVTIPEGVTEIGLSAFVGCTDLTSVTFPSSLTKIGPCAFSGCTNLESVTIPANVTSIESSAFSGCTSLKSVTIPATVTEVGDNIFNACKGLTGVTISDGVTKLNSAFAYCTSLKSVTIPGSVKNTSGAFSGCTGLKGVTIQPGVTEIGAMTFDGCTGLTSVTIPDGVTGIGNAAFSGCTGLKSVTIPASVTKVNRLAFQDCTGLTDVYYGGTEAQWKAMNISKEENGALTSAAIHYNSPMPSQSAQPETLVAYPSTQAVSIDGRRVEFQMYALKDEKGNLTNYVKVRDLALALNGTRAQFGVGWDGAVNLTAGESYAPNGSENSTPFSGERVYTVPTSPTNVGGRASDLQAIVLTGDDGGGYTYYQLRDLGRKLGFNVGWSAQAGVFIETDKAYSGT